jgi:hypothetical protein
VATSDRQILVLLGAGASKDARIPTTDEMTDVVMQKIRELPDVRLGLGLEFILHTLRAHAARSAARDLQAGNRALGQTQVQTHVDVERLFASVDLLIERHLQPWTPFVESWDPGLESLAADERITPYAIERHLREFGREMERTFEPRESSLGGFGSGTLFRGTSFSGSPDRAVRELARALSRVLNEPRRIDQNSLLNEIRDEMLKSLFAILKIDQPKRVDYLNPLLNLVRRQKKLTIASLNYDLAVELLCANHGRACDTGIETWLKGGGLDLRPTGVNLLKLHGSIDWVLEAEETDSPLPLQAMRKLEPGEEPSPDRRPAVVFGEAGKLRSEGPFLELLLKFASELQSVDSLVVVGYSFRDEHVNVVISRWFSENDAARMVVLSPGDLDVHGIDSFGAAVQRLQGERIREQVRGDRGERPTTTERIVPGRVLHVRKKTSEGLSEALRFGRSAADYPVGDTK